MKILQLTAENLLRLRAVDISPDGNVVVISGRNGQGKTSVLNAIAFALGGKAAAKDLSKPIRDGEDHARVVLDMGDIKVTRRWTSSGSTLQVEAGDGSTVFKSPQAMLDELIGRLSFDPLAFVQQSDRDQLATLLELVELPWDPAELAESRQRLYDERTIVNREAKALVARLEALDEPDPETPAEELSAADILAEYEAARAEKARNDELREAKEARAMDVTMAEAAVAELTAALDTAKRRLADERKASAKADRAAATLTDPDVDGYAARLADVEATNRAIRDAAAYRALENQVAETLDKSTSLTESIEMIDETKAEDLAAAAMPIDGLAFDDDGVTYQGVPFRQASAAEQLRVSIAMAMAMNPKVRVIRITDGSLLDSENMALIEEMAGEHDFQVWIERVTDGDGMGVVIEDGLVVEPAEVEA